MSIAQLAKIRGDVGFEIKIPGRDATKPSTVDNRAPHDRVMNHVQRARARRVNNNHAEHRDYEVTRPMFLRSESESDQRHQNADDRNERRSDV